MSLTLTRPSRWCRHAALASTLFWGMAHAGLDASLSFPALKNPDTVLPALGDASSQSLSPAAERRLGDRIMRSILGDPDVIDDPITLEYLQSMWSSLLIGARQRGEIGPELDAVYAWTPFLVRDRTVNAFALPGGFIGVHLGLMAVTVTPDELASVLAHELSHVTQRHIARMMNQSKQTSWVSLAALVLGAVAASRSPEAAQALILGGQGYAMQGQLSFSRDMEREADRVGFNVLVESGYRADGMALMFEQLQNASRLNDDGSYPYLRSHPLTLERIGEARARMGYAGLGQGFAASTGREVLQARHAFMMARASVLMDNRSTSLVARLTDAEARPAKAGALPRVVHLYTNLVAATQLRDFPVADRSLKAAQKELAQTPEVWRDEALRLLALAELDLDLAAGRTQQARQLFTDAVGSPNPALRLNLRPEVMARARMALALPEVGQARLQWQESASALQTHLSANPTDITAWQLSSSLWSRLGQPLRSVRAEAEAVALSGDLSGAVERVDSVRRRQPLSTAPDLIELAVLDSRAQKWRQMIKQDAKDDGAF